MTKDAIPAKPPPLTQPSQKAGKNKGAGKGK